MRSSEVPELYFNWLYNEVCSDKRVTSSYKELFRYLHSIAFNYTLPMDGNRRADGESLRYRFAHYYNLDSMLIAVTIDVVPCSILEMMVALAIRCEETIMCDPDIGDRTREWFWVMLSNLGLATMSDGNFIKEVADERIDIFINRKYDRYGNGGLFYLPNCTKDMRTIEIWIQLMMYLNATIAF